MAEIFFGVTSLLNTIAVTTVAVADFVKGCRKARGDLLGVAQELSTLTKILEWLKNDIDSEGDNGISIPDSLTSQITSIVSHCKRTVDKIQLVLEQHSGSMGAAKWAVGGKKDVNSLQAELAAYRGALNLTMEVTTL